MTYRHTQKGTLILVTCLLIAAFGIGLSLTSGSWQPAVIMIIIVTTPAFLFFSLIRRIGTDDPQGLADALKSQRT
jgi:hypothetical protein